MNIEFNKGYVYESGSTVEWPLHSQIVEQRLNLTSSINEVGDEYLVSHSYFPLVELLPTSHSEEQIPDPSTDVEKSGSTYYINYTLRDKTSDELTIHYNHGWQDVRTKRTRLLEQSDYMGNSDYPITEEWRTYRQALRDITNQSSPFTITWPTKPE
jgi:hypothetical protein|tara:strand:- start:170 stop:637 length:468 start_codon:yes stop_codon:yes gene_type:complete